MSHAERHHPDDVPHWYLSFLGTDPDHQGKGLASAVLRPVLQRCDGQRLPAYLEASRATLVPFYRRHGFAVINQFHLPAGGPPVWGMWREPLPAASEPRTGGLG